MLPKLNCCDRWPLDLHDSTCCALLLMISRSHCISFKISAPKAQRFEYCNALWCFSVAAHKSGAHSTFLTRPSQFSDVFKVVFGEIRGPTLGWWLTYSYPSHHQQESASLKSVCSALSFQGNTIVSGHIFVVRKIGWPVCMKLSPASSGWKTPKIVAAVTKFDSDWSLFRIAERQLSSELSYKAILYLDS